MLSGIEAPIEVDAPARDVEDTSSLVHAVDFCRSVRGVASTRVAIEWLTHAEAHLSDRLDVALRCGRRPIRTEEQALAILKGVAGELRGLGAELLSAAEALKGRSAPMPAQRAFMAHRRALKVADSLSPA